jgi:hypothetical protein
MPSPFYNTEGRFGWRKLLGTSKVHDIGTGIDALGTDIEASLESKRSIIATEQSRENAAYGTLSTPDEVTLTLPENGLIGVWFQATWLESVKEAGRAAIFIGATQLHIAKGGSAIPEAAVIGGTAARFVPLATFHSGLISPEGGPGYTGDVTTGQTVGVYQAKNFEEESAIISFSSEYAPFGGPCYIFAAAGTYKISVQFKATSGKVAVKNRRLWAAVVY